MCVCVDVCVCVCVCVCFNFLIIVFVSLLAWCNRLKNNACVRRLWAYRTAFELPKMSWTKVRIPFNQCRGHGEGIADLPLDTTSLQRLGIVARGAEDKDVTIALSSIRFYKE